MIPMDDEIKYDIKKVQKLMDETLTPEQVAHWNKCINEVVIRRLNESEEHG